MITMSRLGVALALAATAAIAGCSDDDEVTAPPRAAASVLEVSGDSQSTVAGVPIASPLVVRVVAEDGVGLSGVEVTWGAVTGSGTLSAAADTTDADGLAQVLYTPTAPGSAVVAARVANLPTPVEFTVIAMDSTSTSGN